MRTKLGKKINPKNFLRNAKQEFPGKVWKVLLENTTTWKIKSLTSSLDLCVPAKLTEITVLEASKVKQKSSMKMEYTRMVQLKNVERYQPVKNACAVMKFRQSRHFI